MSIHTGPVLLFQRALHLWVLLFLLTAIPAMDALWLDPVSPQHTTSGPRHALVQPFRVWLPVGAAPLLLVVTLLCALWGVFRPMRPWTAIVLWFGFTALMDLAFLAGSGGQQLIANFLFWNIGLACAHAHMPPWAHAHMPTCAHIRAWLPSLSFWIIRLQLLLAYAATAAHKLSGTLWIEGSAMGIVATDPAFGPGWIAQLPLLGMVLSWLVLLFQITFPIAVWYGAVRVPWMIAGIVFHLGTALWMEVPEMAFAFLVGYAIWLSEDEACVLLQRLRMRRATSAPAT